MEGKEIVEMKFKCNVERLSKKNVLLNTKINDNNE